VGHRQRGIVVLVLVGGGGVCIKLSCKWGVEHVKCMQG